MIFDKQASTRFWAIVTSLPHRLYSDSLLRNSIFIMSSTVITSVIGYLYWVVAAHIYSVPNIGLASALIAATTLTSSFANLGIGSTLIQMLPQRKSGDDWSVTRNAGVAIGTLTSLLAGITIAIVLPLFSNQFAILRLHIIYAIAFVIGVLLWTATVLLDQVFVAERATNHVLVRNVVFAILKLLLMALIAQGGVFSIFSSWILALAITLIGGELLLVPRLKRAYRLAVRGMAKQVRAMFSLLAGHHFINLGSMLPMYLLPILVTVQLSATDNAYFYTTWMIGSIFFMISPSVATSLFAEGSYMADSVLHKAAKSILIISALLVPAMLATFMGGRIILSLFGPDYVQHSLILLTIFTMSAIPDAITNIYVSVLRVQKRLRLAASINLGMAFLTLTLAWILLPQMGIIGTGWAFLISQTAGSLVAAIDLIFTRSRWYWSKKPGLKLTSISPEQQGCAEEPILKPNSVLQTNMADNHITKMGAAHKFPKKVILREIP